MPTAVDPVQGLALVPLRLAVVAPPVQVCGAMAMVAAPGQRHDEMPLSRVHRLAMVMLCAATPAQ
jgi:hypothetical protein